MGNVIVSVTCDGVTRTDLPAPSVFEPKLSDLSASSAGRTADGEMHKAMVGQITQIQLGWKGKTISELGSILRAFNPDPSKNPDGVVIVEYIDPYVGGSTTQEFYVGDRSTPLYSQALDLWDTGSFSIIGISPKILTEAKFVVNTYLATSTTYYFTAGIYYKPTVQVPANSYLVYDANSGATNGTFYAYDYLGNLVDKKNATTTYSGSRMQLTPTSVWFWRKVNTDVESN